MDVVEDWTKLTTVFMAEYLELDEYMGTDSSPRSAYEHHAEL